MSDRHLSAVLAALLLSGCGGGLASTGSYCIEIDPPAHDFGCELGSTDVTITNTCTATLTLSEPSLDEICAERVTVTLSAGATTLAEGESATFTVEYTSLQAEAWDCTVAFQHDLASEPAPELPLAGGGADCQ